MCENIIKLTSISKSYSGNTVFSDITFNVTRSKITSVIGPNGCGKTTLFKIILGMTDPEKGEILRPGRDSFGFMMDDYPPFSHLNLINNLNAFSKLYKTSVSKKKISNIISETFCDKIKSKIFRNLSAGQKKKVMFAISLLNDPEILILDEPLNSLDLKERIDMISSIKYMNRIRNKTLLVSSHDLNSLYELCDNFCFIKNDRIESVISKNNITSDELTDLYLHLYT